MVQKYFKGMSAFVSLMGHRIINKPIPWHVLFFITDRCNMACEYCFIYQRYKERPDIYMKRDISFEKAKELIDGLHAMGTRVMTILGGEPLLHKDVGRIGKYISDKGIITGIFTNGVFIHERIEELKNYHYILVSLEGDQKTHEADRMKGSYRKIINNINLIKDKIKVPITLNVTVTKNTIDSIDHLIELTNKNNLYISVGIASSLLKKENERYVPSMEKEMELWQKIKRYKKAGYNISTTDLVINNLIKYHDFPRSLVIKEGDALHSKYKKYKCFYGRYYALLDVDGTLYPCDELYGINGKNIFELGFEKAWKELHTDLDCVFCKSTYNNVSNGLLNYDPACIRELFTRLNKFMKVG